MKQEYNKKVIIIDNKLYDLQEIKSVGAYNKLKETSEKAFCEELKIKNEIEERALKEKTRKEKEQKLATYYDKARLLALLAFIFNAIELGFIEDEDLYNECENVVSNLCDPTNIILENYEKIREYFTRYYGELEL